MKILDGKRAAEKILADLARRIRRRRPPCLATIQVGRDPASAIYLAAKEKAARRIGMKILAHRLPPNAAASRLERLLARLNSDRRVDAILLQLPLPAHLAPRTAEFLERISPAKDADGLHPLNQGRLFQARTWRDLNGVPLPCTPAGVLRLLAFHRIPLEGRRCVVIGRSALVGKPLAHMLLLSQATVTICHSRTRRLAEHTRRADLVFCALGRPGFLKGGMIRRGAAVVDIGLTRTAAGLAGDCDWRSIRRKAAAATPVPGGVGPMTVAMLLFNSFLLSRRLKGDHRMSRTARIT